MIPFDENGNLPPGVHWVEWEEFEEQFNYNPTRQRLIDGLKLAMTHLSAAGCRTIYINGSFTTSKEKPGDFDACWDAEYVDRVYLLKNAPTLLNPYDKQTRKAKYKGDIFRSDELVGDLGINSFEFFREIES